MDVISFFVTYTETTEFEQPTEDPLDDTTMNAQPTAVFRISLGDERRDAAAFARACGFSFRRRRPGRRRLRRAACDDRRVDV